MKPITPTVHLNGTSREALHESFVLQQSVIEDAIRVLEREGPNGRDYYSQGPDAYRQAADEHRTRIHKLTDLVDELQVLVESVME